MRSRLLLPLFALAVACQAPSADEETLRIGFIGPLSGDSQSFGQRMKNAVELALREFEDQVDVSVELIAKDDAMDVSRALQALHDMIEDDSVIGVVAAGRSLVVQSEAELAKNSALVLVSPTATAPGLSHVGPHFFRVVPTDAFQGSYLARCALNRGVHRVAVAYLKDDYGEGLQREFRDTFERYDNASITTAQEFRDGETDFRSLLIRIMQDQPDGVFVAGMPQEIADLLIDASSLTNRAEVVFFAPEVFRSPDSLERAGQAAEGVMVSGTEVNLDQSFVDRYRREFTRGQPDQEPDAFAANAYDAAKALLIAIKSGARTRTEVGDKLRSEDFRFSGASGAVSFDGNGDIRTRNYNLYLVKNGEFVPVDC